jgi:hypothetical protein
MRLFMHKASHAALTWVMLWLAYSFADDVPTFLTNHAFDVMGSVMTEHHWALLCATVGLAGLVTLFVQNWIARIAAAGLLSAGHFLIASLFYLGNPHGTGTGPYLGYAFLGAALAYSTAHLGQRLTTSLEVADPP